MIIEDTLLDRAMSAPKGVHRATRSSDEMVELAIAYVNGSITSTQAATALSTTRQSACQRMWTQLVRAVRDGKVTVRRRGGE